MKSFSAFNNQVLRVLESTTMEAFKEVTAPNCMPENDLTLLKK